RISLGSPQGSAPSAFGPVEAGAADVSVSGASFAVREHPRLQALTRTSGIRRPIRAALPCLVPLALPLRNRRQFSRYDLVSVLGRRRAMDLQFFFGRLGLRAFLHRVAHR